MLLQSWQHLAVTFPDGERIHLAVFPDRKPLQCAHRGRVGWVSVELPTAGAADDWLEQSVRELSAAVRSVDGEPWPEEAAVKRWPILRASVREVMG